MNELLQKHGCSNVFTVPEGLKELMSDITREVLRWQPAKISDFIANYLSAMLITREHGIMAVKILDDLCDCRPTVAEHLLQIGLDRPQADDLAAIIKDEIEVDEPVEGKEKVRETEILKKVLHRYPLDEEMSVKVCQVARNAYRDYWYRKNMMKKAVTTEPDQAWEKAAQHTLEIYKKTHPSISELRRATEKIQAAYRGYHVRRNVLKHLMPHEKKRRQTRKVELPGPPLDIATSREIDLGPVIRIKTKDDDVGGMFDEEAGQDLGLKYDPKKTITHADDNYLQKQTTQIYSAKVSIMELPLLKSSKTSAEDIPAPSMIPDHEKDPTPGHYQPHHRISFAEKVASDEVKLMKKTTDGHGNFSTIESPTIIKNPDDEALEVPEMPGLSAFAAEAAYLEPPGAFEIPEELAGEISILSARSIEDDEDQYQLC